MANTWGSKTIVDNVRQTELMDSNKDGYGITKRLLLSDIDTNPYNFFSMDDAQINELAEDIKRQGVLQAIIVVSKDDGRYLIIDGERRYRAAMAANLEAIPAQIRTFESEFSQEYALIQANMTQRQLNDSEKLQAVKELTRLYNAMKATGTEIKGKVSTLIGDKLGMSGSAVKSYQRINNKLIPEWQTLFKNQSLSFTNSLNLAAYDEDAQRALFEFFGPNLLMVNDLIKNKSDLEKAVEKANASYDEEVELKAGEKAEELAREIVNKEEQQIKFDYETKLAAALQKVSEAELFTNKLSDNLKSSRNQAQELADKLIALKSNNGTGNDSNNPEVIKLTEELNRLKGNNIKLERKVSDYEEMSDRLNRQAENTKKDIMLASFISIAKEILECDAFGTDNTAIIDQAASVIELCDKRLH